MGRSQHKGAIYSLDALFAALAVVVIVYLGFIIFWTIASRTLEMADSDEKYARLLMTADYLTKVNLTSSDESRVYQHQLQPGKLEFLDTKKLADELGLKGIRVSLLIGGKPVSEKGSGRDCIRRLVWVPEYERVGYLETCIE